MTGDDEPRPEDGSPDDGSDDAGDGDDSADGSAGPRFDREAVFDPAEYCYFYGDRIGPERSAREAAFLVDALKLSPGDRLLDAPCGHGRISNRVADRCRVVGLDRSRPFLDRARGAMPERGGPESPDSDADLDAAAPFGSPTDPGEGAGVDGYVRGDLRHLPVPDGAFDAVCNLFTSFGYFDEAGNRRTLSEFARVLRPGGRLLVDTFNPALTRAEPESTGVVERGDDVLVDQRSFDPRTGRTRTERTTVRDGETRRSTYTVRAYTYPEMVDRLDDAGLDVVADYGDTTEGGDYDAESGRLVLVAERR